MLNFIKKTPQTASKSKLRILIGCLDFSELTGMPTYMYRLGEELVRRGIEVTIVAKQVGGSIGEMATNAGIQIFRFDRPEYKGREYDILLLNETASEFLLDQFASTPAWNFLHSKGELDSPIKYRPQIRGYLAPREEVAKHWEEQLSQNIDIIPIPIDFKKFKKRKGETHKEYRILAPCTLDPLRRPMLLALVKRASQDKNVSVRIVGKNYGALDDMGELPPNVEIRPETPAIEKEFAWADEIAGIFIGTVTLEAWAMGKKTSVYDESGDHKMVKPYENFEKLHSIKAIANKFLEKFSEKWADIIIPHHDQAELLAQTLRSIPLRNYNVIISRGGTFAQNNNKGARIAETDTLIFANDDLVISPQVLWEMTAREEDITGVRQVYPDGQALCLGICFDSSGHYMLTDNIEKALYPSGAFFAIKRKLFEKLKGFDERFINGAEDQDLFLRALESKASVGFVQKAVTHYCSQSTGRFDYNEENDRLLFSTWTPKRLEDLFGENYKNG